MTSEDLLSLNEEELKRAEEIEQRIAKWMDFCSPERGYDWSINNWRTVRATRNLERAKWGHVHAQVSVDSVHKAFTRFAHEHRRRTTCALDGIAEKTVTPQWEPHLEVFEDLLRLFGVTEDAYADAVRVA